MGDHEEELGQAFMGFLMVITTIVGIWAIIEIIIYLI